MSRTQGSRHGTLVSNLRVGTRKGGSDLRDCLLQRLHDILNFPKVVGYTSDHGRSHPQTLVDSDRIVVHKVERDGVLKVLDLLAERIG